MKIFFNAEEKNVLSNLLRAMAENEPSQTKLLKSIEGKIRATKAKFKTQEIKFIRLVAHSTLESIELLSEEEKKDQAVLCNYLMCIVDRVNAKFHEGMKIDDVINLRKES